MNMKMGAATNGGGWEHQSDMDVGDDKEFDVKGPIKVDTHNPSAGVNGARYHVDWHALFWDE
ncbi:MAG: hypothetical protein NVV74_01560 [Magnetospirillum sp.]|nr:hypothetical protein [Magnetospirillum sp.]